MRPCTAWFIYSKIHVVGDESSVSLEITWRGPKTETSQHFFNSVKERGRQRHRDRKEERGGGWVRKGWGVSKKVWTPAPLWPVKITQWAFRVSEDKGGRGVRSFSARQGTAHAWLTLWIPLSQSICSFFSPCIWFWKCVKANHYVCCRYHWPLRGCVRACVRACALEGKPPGIFFSCTDFSAASYPNRTAECLWEAQRFCPMCFAPHAAPEV